MWPKFKFFALVRPDNDVLPVRTVYNGVAQNIGINYLTSKEPIWFAGPDIIASILLTGSVPSIDRRKGNAVADEEHLARIANVPKREFMRRGINQHTLEKICKREPVRAIKLAKCLKVLEECESENDIKARPG